jgi:Condensation domain
MSRDPGVGPGLAAAPEGTYPMSYEQESLWLGDQVNDAPSRYLESWACRLTGRLDVGAVEWAISQIAARHEVLRSQLTTRDGDLVQVVTPPRPVAVTQLSCCPAVLSAELTRITAEPLDIGAAPFRPWLVRVAAEEFVLAVQFHHTVVDDWALDVFQRELTHFYTARVLGRPASLEPLPMQVGGYAIAQRAAGLDLADVAYWRRRVQGAPAGCTIPPVRVRPDKGRHRAKQQLFRVSPELGRAVRAVSRARRTTPYAVFAAGMAVLLRQYADHDEVIFGTPVSHRGAAAVDGMIGCLSDLLPIRLAITSDTSFGALVHAAKAEVLAVLEHQAVPYSALRRMTRRGGTAAADPLCCTALVVDDMRWEPLSFPRITAQRVYIPPAGAKFDVCLTLVAADDGGYTGFCDYESDLYDPATMVHVATEFTELLASCTATQDEPIAKLPGLAHG